MAPADRGPGGDFAGAHSSQQSWATPIYEVMGQTTGHPPGPLSASHHHVDIRCYSLLVGVPDILIIVVIWYRENVLGGTKAVFRCTLYHLKRFLVHGIGTHGYRAGILYTMFRAAGWMLSAGLAALGTRGRGPR